jgi:hypothetical protein
MRLAKVENEFFDFEDPSRSAAELARQIHLVFSDAPPVFLSWTWERQYGPDCQPYTIDWRVKSFFVDQPASVVDASGSPLWAKHVGREVVLVHTPSTSPAFEYQVLEVRSNSGRTFVYSLGVDKISVSTESPFPQGNR